MQPQSMDDRRQGPVFLVVCGVGFCILVAFSVVHYIDDNVTATLVHIALALVAVVGAFAFLHGVPRRKIYRFAFWSLAIGLCAIVGMSPDLLYYPLLMPLLMLFFLGRREGAAGAAAFLVGMLGIMLLTPDVVDAPVYPVGTVLRFLVAYMFVGIVAWSYEKSREQYHALLTAGNERLRLEREQLSDAVSRADESQARLRKTNAELRNALGELRNQAELLDTILKCVSDGVVVTDTDGKFLFVNPSAQQIVGMGPTDSSPARWSETYGTFYPDEKTLVPSEDLPLARAIRGEASDDVELFIRNASKPEGVYISVSGRPLMGDAGTVNGGVIVLRDITGIKKTEADQKRMIRSLQEQTRLMDAVFNSISDGVIAIDADWNPLVVNPSARRITGRPADAPLPPRPETDGFYRPDRETLFPLDELPLSRALNGEATDGVEVFIRNAEKPDGVYVSVSGRPLRDDSGAMSGGVIAFRDVTGIKETEKRLKDTADRLRMQTQAMETIFNNISDGVIAADVHGKFTIFNRSAERIVGIGATDTEPDQWGRRYGVFFADRTTPVPTKEIPLVRAIQGESLDEMEVFVRNPRNPDGVYISVSGRPLLDDSGVSQGGVVTFRDVTDRMIAEEALTQAFAQGKLEIVDTILHNVGNAINSVAIGVGTVHEQLTNAELLRRLTALAKAVEPHRDDWIPYLRTDPQGRKVRPFILALAEDFSRQNVQLLEVVDRVRDRVEHIVDIIRTQRSFESETMARKDVNLEKAISGAVRLLQESLARRGVQVDVDCGDAPKEIRIQESKFHQMLVNLIKNAMEAIDELAGSGGLQGPPRIRIRASVDEEFLVFEVSDNGIGIEERRSRIIFTAGYTTKKEGTGLGLHSTANFVIGSGGQIHALSDGLGKGSTMRVKLRLSSVTLPSRSGTGRAARSEPPPREERAARAP